MSQITREQAIAFAESGIWRDMTDEQVVRLQLFQNRLCMPLPHFHAALERVLGRPVYTHEFASWGQLQAQYLGDNPAPTTEEIMAELAKLVGPDKTMAVTP